MKNKYALIIFLIIGIICFTIVLISFERKIIRVEAASAFYPYAEEHINRLIKGESSKYARVEMVSTNEAYKDIINKKADFIVATEPSSDQKKMVEEAGINLKYKVLYLEPLAILVNSECEIDNIGIEEIQRIYFENDSNWNSYQLEKNNGSQTCFESIVKGNVIEKNHFSIVTMPDIIDRIAEDPKGIGYAFYSYYSKTHKNENAKIISVEGKNIMDKDYPLLFEVYLIYRDDSSFFIK
ncbi:MAG: hypothetical protein K6D97_07015 [Clostridia bacterium]|nr:hypothetical protein [Clostridia bacterium]